MNKKQTSWFFAVVLILISIPLVLTAGGAGTIAYYRFAGDEESRMMLSEFLKDFQDWSDWYWPWEERPKNCKLPPLMENLRYYWSDSTSWGE